MRKKTVRNSLAWMLVFSFALVLPVMAASASGFNFTLDDSTPPPVSNITNQTAATPPPAQTQTQTETQQQASQEPLTNTMVISSDQTTSDTGLQTEPEFGKTNIKGVNIRASASGDSAILKQVNQTGTVFEITRITENARGETWYVVSLGGIKEGFVRHDLVEPISQQEFLDARYSVTPRKNWVKSTRKPSATAAASPTPTGNPNAGVIITTLPPNDTTGATATAEPTTDPTASPEPKE